jgi:hypothetical protein
MEKVEFKSFNFVSTIDQSNSLVSLNSASAINLAPSWAYDTIIELLRERGCTYSY